MDSYFSGIQSSDIVQNLDETEKVINSILVQFCQLDISDCKCVWR